MRINQLYCRFGIGFAEEASAKFRIPLSNFPDPYSPLLVVGCYNEHHYSVVHNHKTLCVIVWAGSDTSSLIQMGSKSYWLKMFNEHKNVFHISSSHWLTEDLKSLGINPIELPVTLTAHEGFRPEPLGDCIYMYKPESPAYNGGFYDVIKASVPYRIIETTPLTYSKEDLIEAYKQSFIGLRFTDHDGLSETVQELGLMGRKVIHNGDLPNCLKYTNDVKEIIEMINREYENRDDHNSVLKTAQSVYDYLNIGENWLNTEYYESFNNYFSS